MIRTNPQRSVRLAVAAALAVATMTRAGLAADDVRGNLIQFNNNGGWSWFEDERAILDPVTNQLLVSSVATSAGLPSAAGAARTGNIEVAAFNLTTRTTASVSVLHAGLEADDHDSAALLLRPDGRYLTSYSRHSKDPSTYYRVSTNPGDATSWQAEQVYGSQTTPGSTIVTYSNLYRLSDEGKTYDFYRSRSSDPHFLSSTDDGSTFSYGGWLTTDPAASTIQRPYVKYASNDRDTIHFLSTEGHPLEYRSPTTGLTNSIYAGYLKGGKLYKSDGTLVGTPSGINGANGTKLGPPIDQFSKVAAAQPEGVVGNRTAFWTTDLAVDANDRPYAVFTSRVETDTDTSTNDTTDHRFYYGRFDGAQWQVHELARAGGSLFAGEVDYTGLVALDPRDPDTLYMSSNVSPITRAPMPHYEIFRGRTADGGATWAWTAITSGSTVDNIRPIMPKSTGGATAPLLWMRGTYPNFTTYDLSVVGVLDPDGSGVAGVARYVDASLANTTRANGAALAATAGTGQGAADGLWHVRAGFGNGATVFSADEVSAEDAPLLRTTVADVAAGTYDVWAYFWSDVGEAWQLQAGLSATTLALIEKQGAEHVALAELLGADAAEANAGDLQLYKVYLGRSGVGADGLLSVYVDDGLGTNGTSRTWYDGVGYALVPEPSALCGALALAAPLARRRRRVTQPPRTARPAGRPC